MRRGLSFQEKAERVLILSMITGILLITFAPRAVFELIQLGLVILVVSTLLQIAVGNIPKDASVGKSLRMIVIILGIVVMVFGVGILLVPILSQLGR
ncbi:hypothetical protein HBA54_13155 [Pelagibius litoralis]|uniref:Uncharacterized protein n=1 Tax=Pelagibius litoralis TaxID=374515 RepID=A0A967EY30_9PROT|nr:hypothetical protein [Pelagibius litoralis]NIA69543.1 hypothetical protein [Pelagibius litoralis]